MDIKLSNEEFDSCLLKKKIAFRLIEAARLVLVHQVTVDSAASMVGLTKNDLIKVKETIKLVEEAHANK